MRWRTSSSAEGTFHGRKSERVKMRPHDFAHGDFVVQQEDLWFVAHGIRTPRMRGPYHAQSGQCAPTSGGPGL